jgi:hypothetical protein
MLALHASKHLTRSRKLLAALGATTLLTVAGVHLDRAAAAVNFPDGTQASGAAACFVADWGISRQFSLYFLAYPTNYSAQPAYAPTYVQLQVINTQTGLRRLYTNTWQAFYGASPISYFGPLEAGTYSVQGLYGRYVAGAWYHSNNWEQIGVVRFNAAGACY